MPVYYDNSMSPFFSQTERNWGASQDWTLDDADTLTLYFRGETDNDPEPLYVGVRDGTGGSATLIHADANAVLATEWQSWHIPLTELQAAGVDIASVREMSIGVGDWANTPRGSLGRIYIDEIWVTKRMQ